MKALSISQIVINLAPWVLGNDKPRRFGVWLQGCSLGRQGACKGCMSKHTHAEGGIAYSPQAIVDIAAQHKQNGGLVVSGGEPTDQPAGLAMLLCEYRKLFPGSPIQVYTGRTLNWITKHHPGVLENIDILVANPFKWNRPPTALAGSDNQVVHFLSEHGKEHFSGWQSWPRKLQLVQAHDDQALLIGIPDRQVISNMALVEDKTGVGS